MEDNLRNGAVVVGMVTVDDPCDVRVVHLPQTVLVVRLQVHLGGLLVEVDLMSVVRPVLEADLAVLKVEGVVGHIQRADGGDLTPERPLYLPVRGHPGPEVGSERAVVEGIGAGEEGREGKTLV